MKRRALLAAVGTAAAGLAGCIDGYADVVGDYAWVQDVGGSVHAATDGRVFYVENWQDDGDGSVAALDATDGERLWSFGSSHGYSTYTDLTVHDGVYVGYGDDAVGSGAGSLHALELDGAERWTADTGSVYDRPLLDDDRLFAGSDDGVVRAFDSATGEVLWRHEVEPDAADGPPDPQVTAVDDAVYVATARLLALDPSDGEPRWSYGEEDAFVHGAAVHDGVAYLANRADVVAVEDGEERWRESFESSPRVTVDEGRVFVRSGTALLRFDPDGTKRWSVDVDHLDAWTVHHDRVYAAGTTLYAVDAAGGEELWSEPVAEGQLDRIAVAPSGDDHAVFVEAKNEAIHRVSSDGEVTWSESVPGNVRSYVVDGLVYVGSSEGVYALSPE